MGNLTRMRFGPFRFPVNPAELTVVREGKTAESVTALGARFSYLGEKRVRVRGNGYFTGENAMGTYLRFEALFGRTETLFLPGRAPMEAVLQGISLIGVRDENTVQYAFEFTGVLPDGRPRPGTAVRAKGGESLWDVAERFGVSVDALCERNPRLPCITELREGEEVILP